MIKHEVFHQLVGMPFESLPAWLADWARIDPKLLSMEDINSDGRLQLSELHIGADIMVLAASEIAQMPYVMTALVAAGALAAALSTADGLLLTLSNALSHDTYYHYLDPHASTAKRVTAAKILLLVLALLAAYVATLKPGDLLFMVSVAFSLAAAAFFPALVLGIFWRRANGWGAAAGMLGGLLVTGGYILWNASGFRAWAGLTSTPDLLWGIEPISAGVLGVPVGLVLIVLVSMLTGPPQAIERSTVAHLRRPPKRL
jgi:cation/acetate symporter